MSPFTPFQNFFLASSLRRPQNRWTNYRYDQFITSTSLIIASTTAFRPLRITSTIRYDAFQNPRYAWTCCKRAFFMIAEGFPDCSSNSSVTRRGANEVCISLLGPGLAGRASPPVWISIRWNLAEHSNLFDPKASAFVKLVKPRQARYADHYY
jgi:hypothetical protein